ncbi:MAG: serine hydrolase [Bacillota bacterium]
MTNTHAAVSAPAVSRMLGRLEKSGLCMHGFALMRDGLTAAEGYWAPLRAGVPHRMFSVSKSMTSLAVGLLKADGKLKLTDSICDYFPDKLPKTVPGPLLRLTIRDMLRMASCHRFTTYKLANDEDWTRSYFTHPPTHEPGTVFCYDTSSSHTLAALAERLSGMPLLRFLQTRLFDIIGASDDKRWLTDPMGVSQGGTGLVLSLRDLAKVAQFCLRMGEGTALEPYLQEATLKQIDTPLQDYAEQTFGYGYQFWRMRNNSFAMYGMGGQLALCLPDLQTVFCTIADTQLELDDLQKICDAFWQEVYPGLFGETRSPQGEWDALEEKINALSMRAVENNDTFAGAYGREYAFDLNPLDLRLLCLRGRELIYENASGRHTLPFGVGSWAASTFPALEEPCVTSAGWIAPQLFRLTSYMVGDRPCGVDMLLSFAGDRVTVQMKSVRELHMAKYGGVASGTAAGRR